MKMCARQVYCRALKDAAVGLACRQLLEAIGKVIISTSAVSCSYYEVKTAEHVLIKSCNYDSLRRDR